MRHRDKKGIIDEEPVGGEREEEGCFSEHGITTIYVVYYGGVEKQRRETLF